jgi:hypothetical protein
VELFFLLLLFYVGRTIAGKRLALQRCHGREGLTTAGRAILGFYRSFGRIVFGGNLRWERKTGESNGGTAHLLRL